jgi:flagellar hook-associated protein 2
MDLGISGLASGFDWRSLVDQLADVERVPQDRLRAEQSTLRQQSSAYTTLKSELSTLKTRVDALMELSLYGSRTVRSSDSSRATANVTADALLGTLTLNIQQLAKAARWEGATNLGIKLSASPDVSGVLMNDARWASPISAGVFSVNGKAVTVAETDSLQDVFSKISEATGGEVTANYDPVTDRITLTRAGSIVLGSAGDTSNFLAVARLNSGTGQVMSGGPLSIVRLTDTLSTVNLATAITGDAEGQGSFKINGVTIAYDLSRDTMAQVLQRINDANAGVRASYDAANGRFVLANEATGDMGVRLEDDPGSNFLAATGLATGNLVRGQNLVYSMNGGSPIVSPTNSITSATSGVAGLTVSALKEGEVVLEVSQDSDTVTSAIKSFLEQYNKVQALIDTQTASSTDAKGKVTAGVLAGQSDAADIARQLRLLANQAITGLAGNVDQLADLGIDSSGYDNALTLRDSAALSEALQARMLAVRSFFTEAGKGLAAQLSQYLDRVVGEEGSLQVRQDSLTKQIGGIDTQVADLERIVQSNREAMINNFVAMEKAQARMNQQLQFLLQRFGGTTA